jgi:hypothetical protein
VARSQLKLLSLVISRGYSPVSADVVSEVRAACECIGRVHVLRAQTNEDIPNAVTRSSVAVVLVVVATRRHASLRARIGREVARVRNVVGVQGGSLTIAFAITELLDGVVSHLGGYSDMSAFADVAGVFVLGVASEDISTSGVESESRAAVLIRHGAAVLIHGRVCIAAVDGLGKILHAEIFGNGV